MIEEACGQRARRPLENYAREAINGKISRFFEKRY